jgi:hypothetical protein
MKNRRSMAGLTALTGKTELLHAIYMIRKIRKAWQTAG